MAEVESQARTIMVVYLIVDEVRMCNNYVRDLGTVSRLNMSGSGIGKGLAIGGEQQNIVKCALVKLRQFVTTGTDDQRRFPSSSLVAILEPSSLGPVVTCRLLIGRGSHRPLESWGKASQPHDWLVRESALRSGKGRLRAQHQKGASDVTALGGVAAL